MDKSRVLLVDDDPSVVVTLAAVLEEEFDVTVAYTGTRAVEVLQAERFHVICVDYQMPDLTGLQVLQRAAVVDDCASQMIVTGELGWMDRPEAVSVVFKPCEPISLLASVRHLANLSAMRRAVREAAKRTAQTGKSPMLTGRVGAA